MTDVTDDYVQKYIDLHKNMDGMYRVRHSEYDLINYLLPEGYSALILGCGTLGWANLMKASRIVGVDSSPKMMKAGKKLNPTVDFYQADISRENLCLGQFDYVEVGLQGSFVQASSKRWQHFWTCVKPGGIMLIKCTVSGAEDLLGDETSSWKQIYWPLFRWYAWAFTPNTANEVIVNFMRKAPDAHIIRKWMQKDDEWAGTKFYTLLRKR